MPILNHFEEIFLNLAPSNRFDRSVQCPHCKQFSFMVLFSFFLFLSEFKFEFVLYRRVNGQHQKNYNV